MRRRYPQTLHLLILIAWLGLIILLAALWAPLVWIVIGVAFVALLVMSVRDDRRANRPR